jgi:hypothetical protein
MLEQFNGTLLAEMVFRGQMAAVFHANFVDARLTTTKTWRDVYRYEGDRVAGWTRYHVGPTNRVSEFTPEGWLIVRKDDKGRAIEARTVIYRQEPPMRPAWVNTNPLEQKEGEERITFEYEAGKRKIKTREKIVVEP